MKGMPRNAYIEARIAMAGPLLGSLAAFLLVPFQGIDPVFMALAIAGIHINLFNLLPIYPMDGGRIAGAVSPSIWWLGIAMGTVLFLKTRSPLIFIVLVLGAVTAVRRIWRPVPGYDRISGAQRVGMGLCYVGLAALLTVSGWVLLPADLGSLSAVAGAIAAGLTTGRRHRFHDLDFADSAGLK